MKTRPQIHVAALMATIVIAGCSSSPDQGEGEGPVPTPTFGQKERDALVENAVRSLEEEAKLPEALGERPLLLLLRPRDKTDEHIDTRSIMNGVRVGLASGSRYRLAADLDREAELAAEVGGGALEAAEQAGAALLLRGELSSVKKKRDGRMTVRYTLYLELVEVASGQPVHAVKKDVVAGGV